MTFFFSFDLLSTATSRSKILPSCFLLNLDVSTNLWPMSSSSCWIFRMDWVDMTMPVCTGFHSILPILRVRKSCLIVLINSDTTQSHYRVAAWHEIKPVIHFIKKPCRRVIGPRPIFFLDKILDGCRCCISEKNSEHGTPTSCQNGLGEWWIHEVWVLTSENCSLGMKWHPSLAEH